MHKAWRLLVLFGVLVACGTRASSSTNETFGADRGAPSPVVKAIEALREEGGAFVTSVSGAAVRVTREGAISLIERAGRLEIRTRGARVPFTLVNGAVTGSLAEGVERVVTHGSTLEQTWTYASRPHGRGPLTVVVDVDVDGDLVETDGAVRLGTSGARYGSAVWVDANGVKSPVSMKVRGKSIELTVASRVLDTSSYPAVLDPTISPAPSVDGTVVDAATTVVATALRQDDGGTGVLYRLAFDGTNYVAAWLDGRTDSYSIFASRVSEAGVLLDPAGIAVAPPPAPQPAYDLFGFGARMRGLAIAASPAGTIIAWRQEASVTEQSVYAVRIGVDGKKRDLTPIRLATPALRHEDAALGFNDYFSAPVIVQADDSGFRAVVLEPRPGGGVHFVSYRLRSTTDSNADAVASRTVVSESLTRAPDFRSSPWGGSGAALLGDATSALLTWNVTLPVDGQWHSRAFAIPVSEGGTPSAVREIASLATDVYVRGGSWGKNGTAAIVIDEQGTGAGYRVHTLGRTAAESGEPSALDVATGSPAGPAFQKGDDLVMRFNTNTGGVCMKTLDRTGAAKGECVAIPQDFDRPQNNFGWYGLVAGNTTYLDNSETDFVSLADQSTLRNLAHPKLNRAVNRQTNPSIATDGESYVVVWRDDRLADIALAAGGGPAVYAARLDLAGNVTSGPLRISVGAVKLRTENFDLNPDVQVIFDGTKFFAVWSEADPVTYFDTYYRRSPPDVVGAALSRRGELAVEKFLVIAPTRGGAEVAVASDGVNRVVALSDVSEQIPVTVGARVSIADDNLLDPVPFALSTALPAYRTGLTAAFDGQRTLVAWSEVDGYALKVRGRWVPKGERPAGRPVTLYEGTVFAQGPKLASDRKNGFLLTWQATASANFDSNLWGKFIPTFGDIPPDSQAFQITSEAGDERSQSVAVTNDGANYLVTWADNRSGNYDIYGAWLAVDEPRVRDPKGVLLSAEPRAEHHPSFAAASAGSGLLVYQAFDDSPQTSAFRIRTRAFTSGLVSASECTKNEECATRFCVNGFCCSKPCSDGCGVCDAIPGTCTPKAKGSACGRLEAYLCDGEKTSCTEYCGQDADCRTGDRCVANVCEPFESRCKDEHTEQTSTGEIECGLFKCLGAHCLTACGSVDDCRAGYVCDGKNCVLPPAIINDPDPACSIRPTRTEVGASPLLVVALAVVRRFRRRGARVQGRVK